MTRVIDITVVLALRNRSTSPLANVQVDLPLTSAFWPLLKVPAGGIELPADIDVLSAPAIAPEEPVIGLNSNYNGGSDARLLPGTGSLAASGSYGSATTILVPLRFSFNYGYSPPRTPLFLFATASAGTVGANPGFSAFPLNGAVVTSTAPLPPAGATTWAASVPAQTWPPLSSAPANPQSTPVMFFDLTERLHRDYSITGYSDGAAMVSWSSAEGQWVQHYLSSGFDLRKTPLTTPPQYYSNLLHVSRKFPAPYPWEQLPADIPALSFAANIEMSLWFRGNWKNQPPTAAEVTAAAPASESWTRDLFILQATSILDLIKSQAAIQASAPPPVDPASLSDRDLMAITQKFRVRRYDIDSNNNGLYDRVEMQMSNNWLTASDTGGLTGPGPLPIPAAQANYAAATGATVIINEICALNTGCLEVAGTTPDWVELHNISAAPVNLTGWSLRDQGAAAGWFTFPVGGSNTLQPGGFMVLLCGGPANPGGNFRSAAFDITTAREDISLVRANGTTADTTAGAAGYGGLPANATFGRVRNTVANASAALAIVWDSPARPTPGAGNDSNGVLDPWDPLAAAGSSVVLSEVCADNAGTLELTNSNGGTGRPDWIELHNLSAGPVNVGGWGIRRPVAGGAPVWLIPPGTIIPAGGYLIIVCQAPGINNPPVIYPGFLNTNFNVPKSFDGAGGITTGYPLQLLNATSAVVDDLGTVTNYGSQEENISFGRYLDPFHASGQSPLRWGYLASATPGTANSGGYPDNCPAAAVSMRDAATLTDVLPGVYSRTAHPVLEMTATIPAGVDIHYTTNGTVPTAWSAIFDPASPPRFDRSVTLRAVALSPGCRPSRPITKSYLFKESVIGPAAGDPALLPGAPPLTIQSRPPDYPTHCATELPNLPGGLPIPYGTSPVVAAAQRTAIMAGLSNAPTLSIVAPPTDLFDKDHGGIYACSALTPSLTADPRGKNWERVVSMEWIEPGNAQPGGISATADPDGPGLTTTVGTALAAGSSVTLAAPFTLRARVRNAPAIPGGATEDTPQWSNLLHVEIPTLP